MGKIATTIMNTLLGIIATTLIFYATYAVIFSLYASRLISPTIITNTIATEEIKPSYKYLKSITVRIANNLGNLSGTGVIVKIDKDYTYILTVDHLVDFPLTNYIILDSKTIEMELVKSHNNLDLAVFKLKGKIKGKQSVKGFSQAKPQDKVYVVGHHLGREFIYGEGVFAGYEKMDDVIQIPTSYGSSGSGIIDKHGNLIAIVIAINFINKTDIDASHAIAIDVISIELFLKKLNLI